MIVFLIVEELRTGQTLILTSIKKLVLFLLTLSTEACTAALVVFNSVSFISDDFGNIIWSSRKIEVRFLKCYILGTCSIHIS